MLKVYICNVQNCEQGCISFFDLHKLRREKCKKGDRFDLFEVVALPTYNKCVSMNKSTVNLQFI